MNTPPHIFQMVGKSEYLHAVHVADPALSVGDIAEIEIIEEVKESGDLAPGGTIPGTGGSTPEMEEALFAF